MNPLLSVLVAPALVLAALAWFTQRSTRRIEQLLPPRGRFVDVPGARLHVREFGKRAGSAPALLLVHGLGGQMAYFDYGMVERLARRWCVVAVDLPGCGHSLRAPGAAADVSAQAAALAALVRQLGLERPTIVGHSLGGAVALAMAIEQPACVGALALVAPLTHAPGAPPAVLRALTMSKGPLRELFARTLVTPVGIAGGRRVLAAVFAPDAAPRDFPLKGGALLSFRPRQFLAASRDLEAVPARLPAIEARYGELALPVGVLFARQDPILDWRVHGQALVERVPGARLELVDGGHMLPVTRPALTAAFVERIARRAAAAARGA